MEKKTLQDCQEVAAARSGKCLSAKYVNKTTKMVWECSSGHTWLATFGHIKNSKSWCPFCSQDAKHTIENCENWAKSKKGKCLSLAYKNANEKLIWSCEYGHIWEANFKNIKNKNAWCPFCAKRARQTINDCINLAKLNNGNCLSNIYKNSDQRLTWQCKSGHIWKTSFNKIQQGRWCPHCANHISKAQREICALLQMLYPDLQIILNDTYSIKPMHLDIYIPLLKIGIEYDGEYWHYSDWAIKNGSLDKIKKKELLCAKNGIYLIRVREKDWNNCKKTELIKIREFIANGS